MQNLGLLSTFLPDNISFAQNTEEELLYFPPIAIYSVSETQDPSLTIWDNRLILVALLPAYEETQENNDKVYTFSDAHYVNFS